MDLRKIKKLIELLEDSALVEMEITEGENTIRLSRANILTTPLAPAPPPAGQAVAAAAATPSDPAAVTAKVVTSPLVGTFYNSPSPNDKPYVVVGAAVGKGDTLCLIEAMKTFNQIDAEIAGTVTLIHKNNGDPVEYGEPLFTIEPGASNPGRDEHD